MNGDGLRAALAAAAELARSEVRGCMEEAPRELERAAREVLSGPRHGRLNAGLRRASAPGEPPAAQTGAYRESWRALPLHEQESGGEIRFTARLECGLPGRALRLERGGGGMAARPHMERIRAQARDGVLRRLSGWKG